ncbi:MAG: site-specific integrase [Coriobacteriales bacterium]|jgi:integrase|nr:site-specific integrase [Coriobacteriales bacterium]
MGVLRDKNTGTWSVQVCFADWQGNRQRKHKRGFGTKREAQAWEREFLLQKSDDLDMAFDRFCEVYKEDRKPRLRASTWETKEHMLRTKVIPYFGNTPICDIDAKAVIRWQNKMIDSCGKNGEKYSPTYLKAIHNQLTAVFTHATKFYGLKVNPASRAGSMGKKNADEMKFWTRDEYACFARSVIEDPRLYYPFEVLYWCGLRLGEMLALTHGDIDFAKKTIRVNKSLQRIGGKDIIGDPKTTKSKRIVTMPDNLCVELKQYMALIYNAKPEDRLFHVSKSNLNTQIKKHADLAGIKQIRVHDLRHSHISLLIELGFSPVAIAPRVGHESIEITLRYAHLFPTRQQEMAAKLSSQMSEDCYE